MVPDRHEDRGHNTIASHPNVVLTMLDARLRDSPPNAAAETELLAEVLDIPSEVAIALPAEATRRALARLHSLVRRLTAAAATDELTGCLQRDAGMAAIGREMDRCGRMGSRLLVAIFSVDSLSHVTRESGPESRDSMIQAVAESLRRYFRSYDLLIRYSEDQFLGALPDADVTSAHERVWAVIERLLEDDRTNGRLLVSVGLAEARDGDTVPGLITRVNADLAVDQRRRRG